MPVLPVPSVANVELVRGIDLGDVVDGGWM